MSRRENRNNGRTIARTTDPQVLLTVALKGPTYQVYEAIERLGKLGGQDAILATIARETNDTHFVHEAIAQISDTDTLKKLINDPGGWLEITRRQATKRLTALMAGS